MLGIPLGLITVATAGTPVPLTLSLLTAGQQAQLPPGSYVAKVEVWPNPAAIGKVFVKGGGGAIYAALPVAASGAIYPWSSPESDENNITPFCGGTFNANNGFQLDAATNGDGAYVTLWVR